MSKREKVSAADVRYFFDYDAETGRLVRIRNRTAGRIGKVVGRAMHSSDRTRAYISAYMGDCKWQNSWLVWAWHYGEFPEDRMVHKNGDTLDDRIDNLALYKDMRRPVQVASHISSEDQPETMLGDLPEDMNTGIYEIRNIKNGRRYIGSAVNVSKRWREHLRQLEEGMHHSRFMQRCWNKNGGENFIFRVIKACTAGDLIAEEQRAIDSVRPEYNSVKTAGSMLGHIHSPETRKKMSESRAKDFSPMTGKSHTAETKLKISKTKTGVKQNPETVKRRAESIRKLKGRQNAKKFTEGQIREIRGRCKAGESNIAIAREFKVSDSVICEIKKRRAYRWVD